MACPARGARTVAMTRSRPPQRGQARTSRSNTRGIRAAEVHARVGPGDAPRLTQALSQIGRIAGVRHARRK